MCYGAVFAGELWNVGLLTLTQSSENSEMHIGSHFRKLLQAWLLWSHKWEKAKKPLEMHIKHIFWGDCVLLSSSQQYAVYGVRQGTELWNWDQYSYGVLWGLLLLRNTIKPQHRLPGDSTATQGRWSEKAPSQRGPGVIQVC